MEILCQRILAYKFLREASHKLVRSNGHRVYRINPLRGFREKKRMSGKERRGKGQGEKRQIRLTKSLIARLDGVSTPAILPTIVPISAES